MDPVHQLLRERAGAASPPAISRGGLCPRALCFVTEQSGAVTVMGGRVGPRLFLPVSAKVTSALGRANEGGRGSPEVPRSVPLPPAACHDARANPAQELAGSSLSNPPAKHSSPSPSGFMLAVLSPIFWHSSTQAASSYCS